MSTETATQAGLLSRRVVSKTQRRAPSPPVRKATIVTLDNFIRAETDMHFTGVAANQGGFGQFAHHRELMPVDNQTTICFNRDVLVSAAVFDLEAGPVTIALPDTGARFMSMLVIDQDHYAPIVAYGPGTHVFTRRWIGTRYMMARVGFFVDADDERDIQQVHAFQNAIKVSQPNAGSFEIPHWDRASRQKVREALRALGATLPDLRNSVGARGQVDSVRHLIATATHWGRMPDKDTLYVSVTPTRNNGATPHALTVGDVPVDAFWSISVHNADGYFEPNDREAYNITSKTARKNADGSITVRFGDCNDRNVNCLPIAPGWNYLVRLYRPRPEILDGSWTFPEATPVS
jgi:hypothetical protein